jgi:hypothetical protein
MFERNEMTGRVLGAVRESVATMELPPRPDPEGIIARGKARRCRRRWTGVAALAVAATVTALAITIPGRGRPNDDTTLKLGSRQVHVELAGYSIDSNTNGTVTITVTDEQSMNPTYMQKILAEAGVPAVIRVGSFCHTNTQPPGYTQVVTDGVIHRLPRRDGQGQDGFQGLHGNVMVITPSAMPQGAELSIGYFPSHVAFTLITDSEPLTCVTTDQPSTPTLNLPTKGGNPIPETGSK